MSCFRVLLLVTSFLDLLVPLSGGSGDHTAPCLLHCPPPPVKRSGCHCPDGISPRGALNRTFIERNRLRLSAFPCRARRAVRLRGGASFGRRGQTREGQGGWVRQPPRWSWCRRRESSDKRSRSYRVPLRSGGQGRGPRTRERNEFDVYKRTRPLAGGRRHCGILSQRRPRRRSLWEEMGARGRA